MSAFRCKKRNERVQAALDDLLCIVSQMKRGEVLLHDQIAEITGFRKDSSDWGLLIRHLKERSEKELKITLWSVPAVGYKLSTPEEQLKFCPVKRAKRASRQLLKAKAHIESIPGEELGAHDQTVRVKLLDGMEKLKRKVDAEKRLIQAISGDRKDNGD